MVHLAESPERARLRMVDTQLRARGISDPRVLAAMGSVPRERFVPEELRASAYEDCALPIAEGQTISQPYMVARTCELGRVQPRNRVLEVGAGSGYQAAVLSRLAREVVTIERIPLLAEQAWRALRSIDADNVQVIVGDGSVGWPLRAPYDCIVVAAAAPALPPVLVEQLADGGRMVIPIGDRDLQRLCVIEKRGNRVIEVAHDACVFVPLVGRDGWVVQRR